MASRFDTGFRVYRIVRARLPALNGDGAFRWGSRWSSPGRYVAYAAESYALALLECMVHFNLGEVPPRLSVTPLDVPAGVSREVADPAVLTGWDAGSPYLASRKFGDTWYDQRRTAVLVVPSVISPFECNAVINLQHPEIHRIRVGDPVAATLDDRLRLLLGGSPNRKS